MAKKTTATRATAHAKPKPKSKPTTKRKLRAKAARKTSGRSRTKPAAGSAKWIVTASGERPIADVAKDLARAGLTDSTVLGAVGSITGSAPRGAVAKLKQVRGVADVSADTPISVGPPDSSDTW